MREMSDLELRDWFAGLALQGYLADRFSSLDKYEWKSASRQNRELQKHEQLTPQQMAPTVLKNVTGKAAQMAWAFADAMMEWRSK